MMDRILKSNRAMGLIALATFVMVALMMYTQYRLHKKMEQTRNAAIDAADAVTEAVEQKTEE